MDWIKNESTPVALDVRDDRINFFVNAYAARQKCYYAVRAVSPGQFKQGPVSADACIMERYIRIMEAQMIRVIQ